MANQCVQLTEVGTMNIFVSWINENNGMKLFNSIALLLNTV